MKRFRFERAWLKRLKKPLPSLCAIVVAVGTAAGCSFLGSTSGSDGSDLQLTVDTLKTSVRDAQRTIVELRTEADTQRKELADAYVARAQFEGRVREAERRLAEARSVIDLQRDELAASRAERDRVSRTSASMQNQLKQLQRQLSKLGGKAENDAALSAVPARIPTLEGRPLGQSAATQQMRSAAVAKLSVRPAPSRQSRSVPAAVPVRVTVKPGDTLWGISQRYRIGIKRLREINQLPDDRIEVGQALWLSAPPDFGETKNGRAE